MNPYEFPDLFSKLVLGGVVSPGVVTLSGHDSAEDWDVQAAKGQTGASSKRNGRPIARFQASFYMVSEGDDLYGETDEIAEWESFQRLIESTVSGPTPIALQVYHPSLARNGITEVVKESIGGAVYDDRGGMTVQVKFIEYRPPRPQPSTGARAGGAAGGAAGSATPAYDPNARARAELGQLLNQASAP